MYVYILAAAPTERPHPLAGELCCTFPGGNKVLWPLETMLLHPSSPLCVQSVVQRAGPQLTSGLEVPAWNLQFVQQSCAKKKKQKKNTNK